MSITQEQLSIINSVNYDIVYRIFDWVSNDNVEFENKYIPMTAMNTPPSTPIIEKNDTINMNEVESYLMDEVLENYSKEYEQIVYKIFDWLNEETTDFENKGM